MPLYREQCLRREQARLQRVQSRQWPSRVRLFVQKQADLLLSIAKKLLFFSYVSIIPNIGYLSIIVNALLLMHYPPLTSCHKKSEYILSINFN